MNFGTTHSLEFIENNVLIIDSKQQLADYLSSTAT
jgi:hypothetical protein